MLGFYYYYRPFVNNGEIMNSKIILFLPIVLFISFQGCAGFKRFSDNAAEVSDVGQALRKAQLDKLLIEKQALENEQMRRELQYTRNDDNDTILKELKHLRDEGLLSEQEYKEKTLKVLDKMVDKKID